MDSTTLIASLQDAVPGAQFEPIPSVDSQTTIYVSRDDVPAVVRALRDRPELAFNFLAEITAVDFWPREPRYELVYLLVSIPNKLRVRVKVRLDGGDARVATVSEVWPAANWLEREVWDLYGITFDNHPDRVDGRPRELGYRLTANEDGEGRHRLIVRVLEPSG